MAIDNKVAGVVDQLGDVVTKSELSGVMNIFGNPEFRNEYVLMDGEPFESELAIGVVIISYCTNPPSMVQY